MSRSYKKTPGYYITCSANNAGNRKKERLLYHRKWRRIVKHALVVFDIDRVLELSNIDLIANKWDMLQDGNYIKCFKDDNDSYYENCKRK